MKTKKTPSKKRPKKPAAAVARKTLSAAEKAARTARTKAEARAIAAKSEKLNIRFTEDEITRIQNMSALKGVRIMPMLREWVLRGLAEAEYVEGAAQSNKAANETSQKHLAVGENANAPYYPQRDETIASIDKTLRELASLLRKGGYLQR